MIRRPPTQIELKQEDIAEYNEIVEKRNQVSVSSVWAIEGFVSVNVNIRKRDWSHNGHSLPSFVFCSFMFFCVLFVFFCVLIRLSEPEGSKGRPVSPHKPGDWNPFNDW